MTQDEFDKLPPILCTGDDLIVIDETNSISDHTVRPLQGADQKRVEDYWAEVKKYRPQDEEYIAFLKTFRPQEYEELMKRGQCPGEQP